MKQANMTKALETIRRTRCKATITVDYNALHNSYSLEIIDASKKTLDALNDDNFALSVHNGKVIVDDYMMY